MSEPSPIVLVVDDEIQIRRFLRTGFELNGFVVHEAGTGAELSARAGTCDGTGAAATVSTDRLAGSAEGSASGRAGSSVSGSTPTTMAISSGLPAFSAIS